MPLIRAFSAKQEFGSEWHQFLHPNADATYHVLDLELTKKCFPFPFQTRVIEIREMQIFLKLNSDIEYSDAQLSLVLKRPDGTLPYSTPDPNFMVSGSPVKGLPYIKAFEEQIKNLGEWLIEVPGVNIDNNGQETRKDIPEKLRHPDKPQMLNPNAIDDLIVVCHYSVPKPT